VPAGHRQSLGVTKVPPTAALGALARPSGRSMWHGIQPSSRKSCNDACRKSSSPRRCLTRPISPGLTHYNGAFCFRVLRRSYSSPSTSVLLILGEFL
jgi:hypothetical protein